MGWRRSSALVGFWRLIMPGLFPVGAGTVGGFSFGGGSGGGSLYDVDASDGVSASTLNDVQQLRAGQMLEDLTTICTLDAATVGTVLDNLNSRIVAGDVVVGGLTFNPDGDSGIAFVDTVAAAWLVALADGVVGADDAIGTAVKMLAVEDALAALGMADSRLSARAACVVALALEDAIGAGWSMDAMSSAALADAALAKLTAMTALTDSAGLSAVAAPSIRVSVLAAESAVFSDDPAATLSALVDASDSALVYCSVRLGNEDYSGWAVNTDLRAVTEHRNVPFDSIETFKGMHFAAGPGGIAQIIGDSDEGEPIEAWVRTFLTDFGTQVFKRAPDLFIGVSTAGDMVLKTITHDPATGVKTEDWYSLIKKQQGSGPSVGRFKVGRGIKSTWWGLELRNVDGAAFDLMSIEWRPLVLDRRQ